jgi:hypothetical protein
MLLRRSSETNRLFRFVSLDGRFPSSRQSVSLSLLRAHSLAAVVIGARGRAVPTSGRECAAPGRGLVVAGQAVRPSAKHGRAEVGLKLGAGA